MGRNRSYEPHDFYCINCGTKGISLFRPQSRKRELFHRKKLYCPHCKQTVNHIECQNSWEIEEFKINFANGVYENEKEESLSYVRASSFR